VVTQTQCTGCRLCEWLCPDWAIVVHPKSDTKSKVAA